MAMLGDPSNLISPLASDSSSSTVNSHLYVAPLRYNRNIELVPWAAESFEVLDHGKHLRFKLRDDITWFDGTPLTAYDVEFTYKMMIDPKTPTVYATDYLAIKELRVNGPYDFEVFYDQVYARALVTWALDVMPKHKLENADLTNTPLSRMPVGAGPYRLKEWIPGLRLTLEANEDYFLGRPYIDQLVYNIIPDMGTQFLELKAGNLDLMSLTSKQYLFQTKGQHWEEAFHKFKYLSFSYSYLGYNLKHHLFKDIRVRRAITHAIDKEELVKGVLLGLGMPAVGPYKPGTWQYNDQLTDLEYAPIKAETLLAEAGWKRKKKDGLLYKDNRPFSFTIMTNQGNTERIKAATIIQHRLRKVGIEVKIRTVEWAAFVKEFLTPGNFECILLSWNVLQDPDIYPVWHSSQVAPKGLNVTSYVNAEVDELLVRGRSTLDQTERKPVYDRIQEILVEEQPYTFLYVPYALPIVQSRVQGIEPAPAGITYNSDLWWVPEKLQRFSLEQ